MITICQGTPGSGKSAVATSLALRHIKRGGVVASNFKLVSGWSDVLALQNPLSSLTDRFRFKKSQSYYSRFFYVDSLAAILSINPRKLSVDLYKDDGKYQEGNGLLILDESQLIFNSRKWNKNFDWIKFFTQHRKLGWNVLMITHSADMIDSQIRPLAEYASTYRNLQKVRLPVVGLPLAPYPTFIVITRYAGLGAGSNAIHSRDLLRLPLWAACLYDSLEVFDESKWLDCTTDPQLCGVPPLENSNVGLFDRIREYWDNVGRKQRVTALSRDCLWSRYEQATHGKSILSLSESDVYRPSWPLSL